MRYMKKDGLYVCSEFGLRVCKAGRRWVLELIGGEHSPYRFVEPEHEACSTRVLFGTLREAKDFDLFWHLYDIRSFTRASEPRYVDCLTAGHFSGEEVGP